jgi:hypothetical protein
MHDACRSAAARLPNLRKRGSEIGMPEVAESVDVNANVNVDVGVDLDLDGDGDGDRDGDIGIQHNTAHHDHDHAAVLSKSRGKLGSLDG